MDGILQTQIIKTLEHFETRRQKIKKRRHLPREKKTQGRIRPRGTQLIHNVYCEGSVTLPSAFQRSKFISSVLFRYPLQNHKLLTPHFHHPPKLRPQRFNCLKTHPSSDISIFLLLDVESPHRVPSWISQQAFTALQTANIQPQRSCPLVTHWRGGRKGHGAAP